MTGSQFPRAASGTQLVIDGDLWNRLMDQVERNGRLYACPPLLLADGPGGKVLSVIQVPSKPGIVVKITANKGTGGQYDGTVMGGTLTPTGSSTYDLPGTLTAGTSVLVVNDDEAGNFTHWIALDTYAEGVYDGGTSTEATPRPVVRIQRGVYRTASPGTLGSSAERLTPDTANWTRTATGGSSTNQGDSPVELWVCTGVFYDDTAGTPALTAHMRKVTLAADGRHHSISAETDYVIDTPVSCS